MATVTPRSEMHSLKKILFSEEEIGARVAELGERITRDYAGKDLVLIGVLKGAITFLSDLSRRIEMPHQIDLVGAKSYKGGTKPTDEVAITKDLDLKVRGRDVLIIEDIYDTGHTLETIRKMIEMERPASVGVCVLIDKKVRPSHPVEIKYCGFEIPDVFAVGYGLDYKENFRNLPCIGVLHPEAYQ